MEFKDEVIIVGAGPTGLMTAALLARSGVRVRIFDQNPEQAHESRALGVQARTLELFLSLGLAAEMLRRGTVVSRARLFVDGAVRAELHLDDIQRADTPYAFMLIVPQRETEAVLNDELRRLGVAVERSVEVTGLAQTDAGVIVRAKRADGAEFATPAAYVVGADGAHSIVRKQLGLSFEGAAYPQDFLLADCEVEGLPGTDGLAIFLRGTQFAVQMPLPGGRNMARIIALAPGPQGDKNAPLETQGGHAATLAQVQQSLREASQSDVTLRDAIWTSLYRVHHRGVDRYRAGRAFVAGDAAHIHSPAGGQGMNTGLQDAANLAWKLVLALRGAASAEALLDTYHAERWPVGQRVLKDTDDMFSTMTSQSSWFATLRNAVMPRVAGVLAQVGAIRDHVFDFISELGIHYESERNAALPDETGHRRTSFWKHGPAAGHRLPNAVWAHHQDVFGLVTGYKFHVLALSRQPLAPDQIAALHDELAALPSPPGLGLETHIIAQITGLPDERVCRVESNGVFKTYGVDLETPQALYLVRPDGYIAWRIDRLDLGALAEFLHTSFCWNIRRSDNHLVAQRRRMGNVPPPE